MKISIALSSVLATSLLAIPLSTNGSVSQERYPSRPVKMIVPYPAGGPTDVPARLVAAKLSAALGGNFYIENVPGAGCRRLTLSELMLWEQLLPMAIRCFG